MEYCVARHVRIVVESPPFTNLYDVLPPSYPDLGLPNRMTFRIRTPTKIRDLYIVTDCVLVLLRPAGFKYPASSGQDVAEDVSAGILNMCLLSVRRPAYDIPNTQIWRLLPGASTTLQSPLICVTSRSTPDSIYADNLSRLAPGHCDLTNAEEVARHTWDDD